MQITFEFMVISQRLIREANFDAIFGDLFAILFPITLRRILGNLVPLNVN